MILSVILTILKIIGILLLALLLLVLLLLTAFLFVPIRYRARVAYTEQAREGEVRITWLLHLVSLRIAYDLKESKQLLQLRIFGISPDRVRAFWGRRKAKKSRRRQEKTRQTRTAPEQTKQTKMAPEQTKNIKTTSEQTKNIKTTPEQSNRKNDTEIQRASGDRNVGENADTAQNVSADNASRRAPQSDHDDTGQRAPQNHRADVSQKSVRARIRNLLHRFRALWDKIRQLPAKALRLFRRLRDSLRKPAAALQKARDFYRVLQEYDAGTLFRELLAVMKRLFRHFRVRRGTGYFRFGTGDPSLTGEITGVIYLFIPASCGEIQIEPQFTESMLQMDLEIRGHVRLIHLGTAAWRIFRNKKLRGLIRAFRKGA
ncbi:MAG: DUF2953 domain-containing protein [Lachnospiraceae bacterium]|nr:DUF2953 domain-containing protein [Lachnospiraceae bacterium]